MAWIGNARIGSQEIQPVLRSHRLTGASVVKVNAAGAGRSLPLREGSLLVKLSNANVRHEGRDLSAVNSGGKLLIEGDAGHGAPASIVLYHLESAAAGTAEQE